MPAAACFRKRPFFTTIVADLTYTPGSSAIFFSLDSGVAQLNGSGDQNLQFKLYSAGPQNPIVGTGYFNMTSPSIAAYFTSRQFASKLPGEAFINASRSFSGYSYMAKYAAGQWDRDGTHGYLDLRFNAGAGDRFGWAEVSYNANESVTLYGFAYEDSGNSILAGATVVPEPTTTGAMAAVFAGSVAAFEARRRRKAARQVQPEPVAAGAELSA